MNTLRKKPAKPKVKEPVGKNQKSGRPGKNSGYAEDHPLKLKKLRKKRRYP